MTERKALHATPKDHADCLGNAREYRRHRKPAAAEKFRWKKTDGKVTKAMVKGGPTAGGGQGTWDVMFIRSAINPETRKPDPATMEQTMVQLDYAGNVKFFEIPKRNR